MNSAGRELDSKLGLPSARRWRSVLWVSLCIHASIPSSLGLSSASSDKSPLVSQPGGKILGLEGNGSRVRYSFVCLRMEELEVEVWEPWLLCQPSAVPLQQG